LSGSEVFSGEESEEEAEEGMEEVVEEEEEFTPAPSLPEEKPAYVRCPICGATVASKGKYAHWRNVHSKLSYEEYRDKWVPTSPPTGVVPTEEKIPKPIEVETIESAIKFLEDRLRNVYGVGSYAKIIISTIRDDPTPLRDPNLLLNYIKSIAPRAYDSHLSIFVIRPLYAKFPNLPAMVDRYLFNVGMQTQQMFITQPVQTPVVAPQPIYLYPQQTSAPQAYIPQPTPTTTVTQPPQYVPPPQPQYYTTQQQYIPPPQYTPQRPEYMFEDRIMRVEERLTRFVEEKFKAIEEKITSITKEEKEKYVEIEEPLRDSDGKILIDSDGRPIIRKFRVPASQALMFKPKEEDPEEKLLRKMQLYKSVFGLDEEKIRKLIEERVPKQEIQQAQAHLTAEDIDRIVSEKISQIVKIKEEEERYKELKSAIESMSRDVREAFEKAIERAAASAKVVEGYKDDAYRVLGQSIDHLARVLETKKPLEVVVREAGQILFGGAPPKQMEEGAAEAESSLLKLFEQKGWITES